MTILPGTERLEATAHWTAAVRAMESARPDALVHDPWAMALAGPAGAAWIAERSADSVVPMILRTRYFDDWLVEVVGRGTVGQAVLPAAGLDTRAFRLDLPDVLRWFEIDRPAVLGHKAQVLGAAGAVPRCLRTTVEADLLAPWSEALVAAGFDPSRPSAWLLEGLLFYLDPQAIAALIDELTGLAAPGSELGFDIVNGAMLTSRWTRSWVEMQATAGAPWIGTIDDPVGFLAARGWQATLTQAGQPDASHGRWTLPVLPTTMPDMPHNWFVTAMRTA